MKHNFIRYIILVACFLGVTIIKVNGQAPQSVNYQAVVRNATGDILSNRNISLRFTISNGNSVTVLYRETFTTATNSFG